VVSLGIVEIKAGTARIDLIIAGLAGLSSPTVVLCS